MRPRGVSHPSCPGEEEREREKRQKRWKGEREKESNSHTPQHHNGCLGLSELSPLSCCYPKPAQALCFPPRQRRQPPQHTLTGQSGTQNV